LLLFQRHGEVLKVERSMVLVEWDPGERMPGEVRWESLDMLERARFE
jgi:hypothetical protein